MRDNISGRGTVFAVVAINCAVYLFMVLDYGTLSFNSRQVVMAGGLFGPDIDAGEYWRLLTANYIHFGPFHIGFNMAALLAFGRPVAARYGANRFLLAYTLSGLAGSLASYLDNGPLIVSAGAPGAIAGIFGMMFVLRARGDRSIDLGELIGILVLNAGSALFVPDIDWRCRVGGILAGVIVAWLFGPIAVDTDTPSQESPPESSDGKVEPQVRRESELARPLSATAVDGPIGAAPQQSTVKEIDRLERLLALKQSGALTEAEFADLKGRTLRGCGRRPRAGAAKIAGDHFVLATKLRSPSKSTTMKRGRPVGPIPVPEIC